MSKSPAGAMQSQREDARGDAEHAGGLRALKAVPRHQAQYLPVCLVQRQKRPRDFPTNLQQILKGTLRARRGGGPESVMQRTPPAVTPAAVSDKPSCDPKQPRPSVSGYLVDPPPDAHEHVGYDVIASRWCDAPMNERTHSAAVLAVQLLKSLSS
jgi:hypothetical protein